MQRSLPTLVDFTAPWDQVDCSDVSIDYLDLSSVGFDESPQTLSLGKRKSSDHGGPTGIEQSKGQKANRARTGCLTCRLRKKRCDEVKPDCETCARLGIRCMGYGKKRPDWLRDEDNLRKLRDEIRIKVLEQRSSKPKKRRSALSDERSQSSSKEPLSGAEEGTSRVDQSHPTSWGGNSDSVAEGTLLDPTNANQADEESNEVTAVPSQEPEMIFPWSPVADTPGTGYSQVGLLEEVPIVDTSHSLTVTSRTAEIIDTSQSSLSATIANLSEYDDMWNLWFNTEVSTPSYPSPIPPSPTLLSPSSYALSSTSYLNTPATSPNLGYLHHYLNVVMPLQFRTAKSLAIGEIVIPLAFQKSEILTSISSLAALHLSSQRTGLLTSNITLNAPTPLQSVLGSIARGDTDALIARSAHRDSLERLRYISSENLASEDVIFPALFAVSYFLFIGGTSSQWREVLAMCQKCLAASLAASPDLTGDYSVFGNHVTGKPTPWKRYRPLMEVMFHTDIMGSLSQNRGTRLLPTYRVLLQRVKESTPPEQYVSMLDVMGCDNTTLLAIAETTALSEWRDRAEETGTLSQRTLVRRADVIERLLSERSWRSSQSNDLTISIETIGAEATATPDEWTKTCLMAEVFYTAAKVYLSIVVNGPYPKVPEISESVKQAIQALKKIADMYPRPDIYRKLVFAITITGCHVDTYQQRQFFRDAFEKLGPEATFGNTKSALALMEEVWRRRDLAHPQCKVCWREVMVEMGWEAGLLLI